MNERSHDRFRERRMSHMSAKIMLSKSVHITNISSIFGDSSRHKKIGSSKKDKYHIDVITSY